MKKTLLCFSFAALIGLVNTSVIGATTLPASPPDSAWEKIPGAAHHPLIRETRLRHRLAPLSTEETERALQDLVAREVSSESAADFLVAVEMLAAKAGAPALEFANKHRAIDVTNRSLRHAFVRGWAKTNLDAAAAWLESVPTVGWDDDETVELARALLKTHARRDPAGAMQRALRYAESEPSRRETFALAVIEELVYHGRFETARELTQMIDVPEMQHVVQADLIGVVAEHQPVLASSWFRELPPDQERLGIIFRLAEAWTTRSLREAVAFFETLEPSERTIDLVESMLVNSSDPKPDVVEHLAKDFPAGPELDRLLVAALNRIHLLSSSDIPWAWFERFTDPRMRDQLLVTFLVQRYRHDPASAKPVVEQLGFLQAEQRSQLIALITRAARSGHRPNQPAP